MKPHLYLRPTPDGESIEGCIAEDHQVSVYDLDAYQIIEIGKVVEEWRRKKLLEVVRG